MFRDLGKWVCSYDKEIRTFTVTWVFDMSVNSKNWLALRLDTEISDPDGNFEVYFDSEIGFDSSQQRSERFHAKAVIRADRSGRPIKLHADFDSGLLGSPTLCIPENSPDWFHSYIWVTEQKPAMWLRDSNPDEWIVSDFRAW